MPAPGIPPSPTSSAAAVDDGPLTQIAPRHLLPREATLDPDALDQPAEASFSGHGGKTASDEADDDFGVYDADPFSHTPHSAPHSLPFMTQVPARPARNPRVESPTTSEAEERAIEERRALRERVSDGGAEVDSSSGSEGDGGEDSHSTPPSRPITKKRMPAAGPVTPAAGPIPTDPPSRVKRALEHVGVDETPSKPERSATEWEKAHKRRKISLPHLPLSTKNKVKLAEATSAPYASHSGWGGVAEAISEHAGHWVDHTKFAQYEREFGLIAQEKQYPKEMAKCAITDMYVHYVKQQENGHDWKDLDVIAYGDHRCDWLEARNQAIRGDPATAHLGATEILALTNEQRRKLYAADPDENPFLDVDYTSFQYYSMVNGSATQVHLVIPNGEGGATKWQSWYGPIEHLAKDRREAAYDRAGYIGDKHKCRGLREELPEEMALVHNTGMRVGTEDELTGLGVGATRQSPPLWQPFYRAARDKEGNVVAPPKIMPPGKVDTLDHAIGKRFIGFEYRFGDDWMTIDEADLRKTLRPPKAADKIADSAPVGIRGTVMVMIGKECTWYGTFDAGLEAYLEASPVYGPRMGTDDDADKDEWAAWVRCATEEGVAIERNIKRLRELKAKDRKAYDTEKHEALKYVIEWFRRHICPLLSRENIRSWWIGVHAELQRKDHTLAYAPHRQILQCLQHLYLLRLGLSGICHNHPQPRSNLPLALPGFMAALYDDRAFKPTTFFRPTLRRQDLDGFLDKYAKTSRDDPAYLAKIANAQRIIATDLDVQDTVAYSWHCEPFRKHEEPIFSSRRFCIALLRGTQSLRQVAPHGFTVAEDATLIWHWLDEGDLRGACELFGMGMHRRVQQIRVRYRELNDQGRLPDRGADKPYPHRFARDTLEMWDYVVPRQSEPVPAEKQAYYDALGYENDEDGYEVVVDEEDM